MGFLSFNLFCKCYFLKFNYSGWNIYSIKNNYKNFFITFEHLFFEKSILFNESNFYKTTWIELWHFSSYSNWEEKKYNSFICNFYWHFLKPLNFSPPFLIKVTKKVIDIHIKKSKPFQKRIKKIFTISRNKMFKYFYLHAINEF